jgi:glutathione synthase/RimK-type ligase-like ATP-grasp enzyme
MERPDLLTTLPTRAGSFIDVRKLNVIWWRRSNFPQKTPDDVTDLNHIDLINNECRTALLGVLLNEFSGIWINEPTANTLAANKLLQLKTAQRAGFRIPRTLVSQDPVKIRQFYTMLGNDMVVKRIMGTNNVQLPTGRLTGQLAEEYLVRDDVLRLCPAIYQEYIPGKYHLRAHCFGNNVYAALIESEELDWRWNLNIPFKVTELSDELKARLCHLVSALGLRMGIIDLKLLQEDSPVWLEINPQGQFLFVEGLSGLELIRGFSDFLYETANHI